MWDEIQDMPGEIYDVNPYVAQILSQGKEPSRAPAPVATYPRTIHGRTYQTEAEYREDLHDFLNGM